MYKTLIKVSIVSLFLLAAATISMYEYYYTQLEEVNKSLVEHIQLMQSEDEYCKCGEYWWNKSFETEEKLNQCVYLLDECATHLEDSLRLQ